MIVASGGGDDAEARDPFDWSLHFASGLLQRADLETPAELAAFVAFSQHLDDGEAACSAIEGHDAIGARLALAAATAPTAH